MTNSKFIFSKLDESYKGYITVANGEKIEFVGKGEINLNIFIGNDKHNVIMSDVLLVPCIDSILISVSKLTENGHNIIFKSNECYIEYSNGEQLRIAKKFDDMYIYC